MQGMTCVPCSFSSLQSHNKVAYTMAKDLLRRTSNAIEPYIQAVRGEYTSTIGYHHCMTKIKKNLDNALRASLTHGAMTHGVGVLTMRFL